MLEKLRKFGVDTDSALERCMGNRELLEKLYRIFPDTVVAAGVKEAFDSRDMESALFGAHSLKGMTGNLSVNYLYDRYSEVVNLLRVSEYERAYKKYYELQKYQNGIIELIKKSK